MIYRKIFNFLTILFLSCLFISSIISHAIAKEILIQGVGMYALGGDDSIDRGKSRAKYNAIVAALEQNAGVQISSTTYVTNNVVVKDDVVAKVTGCVRIKKENIYKVDNGNSEYPMYKAEIEAFYDPDKNSVIQQYIDQVSKLQSENARLGAANTSLKQDIAARNALHKFGNINSILIQINKLSSFENLNRLMMDLKKVPEIKDTVISKYGNGTAIIDTKFTGDIRTLAAAIKQRLAISNTYQQDTIIINAN